MRRYVAPGLVMALAACCVACPRTDGWAATSTQTLTVNVEVLPRTRSLVGTPTSGNAGAHLHAGSSNLEPATRKDAAVLGYTRGGPDVHVSIQVQGASDPALSLPTLAGPGSGSDAWHTLAQAASVRHLAATWGTRWEAELPLSSLVEHVLETQAPGSIRTFILTLTAP